MPDVREVQRRERADRRRRLLDIQRDRIGQQRLEPLGGDLGRAAEVEADPGLGGMEPARRPPLALVGTLEGPDVAGELRPGVVRALLDGVRDPGGQSDEVGGPAVPDVLDDEIDVDPRFGQRVDDLGPVPE